MKKHQKGHPEGGHADADRLAVARTFLAGPGFTPESLSGVILSLTRDCLYVLASQLGGDHVVEAQTVTPLVYRGGLTITVSLVARRRRPKRAEPERPWYAEFN